MRYIEIELDALSEERLLVIRQKYKKQDLSLEQYASELFCKYLKLLQPHTPTLMEMPSEFLLEPEQGRTADDDTIR